jgi:hypothetical protein
MSGTSIGEVNINLRLSLAKFKEDTKSGTQEASRATKQMSQEMRANSQEAKASLALIGEEIGITIPRHIRGLIASIPGVGKALTAAFNSIALIAIIGVIVEIITKISEFRAKAAEIAEAMRKTGEIGAASLRSIEEETLGLEAQIDQLQGNYLGALLKQLKLVNEQSMDKLAAEFGKLKTDFDEVLKKMEVGWLQTMLRIGDDKSIKSIRADFDDFIGDLDALKERADNVGIGKLLATQMASVNHEIQNSKTLSSSATDALKYELTVLKSMTREYEANNKLLKDKGTLLKGNFDKDENTRLDAQVASWDKLNNEVRALMEATRALTNVDETEQDKVIHKIDEQISKWQQLDAEIQRLTPGIKTYYGEEITALENRKKAIEAELQDVQNGFLLDRFKNKGPDLSYASVKPTFAGTSDQLDLAKITQGGPAAQEALQKVLDSVESVNTKFKEQSAILDELHRQYPETFNAKALKQAKDAIDPINKEWEQFGASVSQTIISGQLFGSSWQASLRSIGFELLQLILKMTLLKNLQGGAGAGGFSWSGLLSGLMGGTGHARGGSEYAGQARLVGEMGPELFIPDTSGRTISNDALRGIGGGGGKTEINHYQFDFHGVQDFDSFQKSKDQLALEMAAAISRASRRNG